MSKGIFYLQMLKKTILVLLVILNLITSNALAQIEKPVSWTFSTNSISDTELELIFNVNINKSWHIYSTQLNEEDGPIPTTFHFNDSPNYKLIGKVQELNTPTKAFDKFFNATISWFDNKAAFKQKVLISKPLVNISGYIEYMACNDEKCLPPTNQDFSFNITKESQNAIPDKHTGSLSKSGATNTNIFYIFIIGFVSGLLGLLSPCIYSMIPIVIGYFSKHKKENAVKYSILYSLFILLTYILLGFLITLLFGSAALNNLATNIYFNIAFFIIFILFALSFFGDFEIRLPNFIINKSDKLSTKQNIVGIFFMAFTLVLVSFSCTVPILGTLLVQVSMASNLLYSLSGILGFACSIALPFGLIAIFPRLLLGMPKAGGWMQTIKVTLGFLELALALKFLSNADLAYHLNILDRDTFLSLWIIIFFTLGLYLLGILKIGDAINKTVSGFRLIIAILTLSFSVYMIPGLFGAPLTSISQFLPPMATQKFNVAGRHLTSIKPTQKPAKYSDKLYFTPEIKSFFDYQEAIDYARETHRPVFINFTGHACINCRKMETTVFTDQRIINLLNNSFVVVSLYVDDREKLIDNLIDDNNKPIRTIGQLNSHIQTTKFDTNSQPYYVIIDTDENILNKPRAFDTDVSKFIDFLKEALLIFNKNNG
ncbi:MAG: protein-disulfide reductase DsbD family protein [Solitalea-like symbiont of Tyrophagus putrescentiae]